MDRLQSSVRQAGLPDDVAQSLYQDDRGRIWVFTASRTCLFPGRQVCSRKWRWQAEKFIPSRGTRRATSGFQRNQGLSHLLEGRLVEQIPWSALGRREQASVIVLLVSKAEFGFHSGDGGVLVFQGWPRSARRTQPLMDWAEGDVAGLQLDRDGACGPQPRRAASAGLKTAASLRSQAGMDCPATRFTGR